MTTLVSLTPEQAALADARARCAVEALRVLDARVGASAAGGFVTAGDLVTAVRAAGLPEHDWRAERAMMRAAGHGRWATARHLGEWACLVDRALEAARALGEPLDLAAVSRVSLRWCLAGRPKDHPVAVLSGIAGRITAEDVHTETPQRPYYRQTLDGWQALLGPGVRGGA